MPALPVPPAPSSVDRVAVEARLARAQAACMRWRLSPGGTERYLEACCDVESLERQLGLLPVPRRPGGAG